MKKLYAFIISLSLTLCTACGSSSKSEAEETTTTTATTETTTTTTAMTTTETTTTTTTTTVTTTTPTTTTTSEPTLVNKLILPETPLTVNTKYKGQLTITSIDTHIVYNKYTDDKLELILNVELTVGKTDKPQYCTARYRYIDKDGSVVSSGTITPPQMIQGETSSTTITLTKIKDAYPYTLEIYDY